ncbi:MAG TPA: GYD domain-containing protein [Stellaceae bacterium]|nr:GYD domain-containing protein [Stellaceae bacterium]
MTERVQTAAATTLMQVKAPGLVSRMMVLRCSGGGFPMQTFIMLTRLTPSAMQAPEKLEELERRVVKRVAEKCPSVEWVASYAVLGPCDYLDVFRAPSIDEANRISALVRTHGHAQTETWAATEWSEFKAVLKTIEAPEPFSLP